MNIDDGTAIVTGCAVIASLSGAVVWLWRSMDARYQAELTKRDSTIADLVARVRKLEDERVPTQIEHTKRIEELTDRYDATAHETRRAIADIAKAVREIASNVNSQTEALRALRCKTYDQGLPEPHPAANGTDAITRRRVG